MPDLNSDLLLSRLRAWCFPGGEEAARRVRGIETTQRGEIRMGPDARWNEFTAEEFVDATRAAVCWEARLGKGLAASVQVTDAYENGHGRLALSKGPIPLRKLAGPEVDRGELQRYLSYIIYCPPMLLNNPSLELTATGPLALRVRAVRPMTVGRRVTLTPWLASGSEPQERDGLRAFCNVSRRPGIRLKVASPTFESSSLPARSCAKHIDRLASGYFLIGGVPST